MTTPPSATTTYGNVRGCVDRGVNVFRGVPYAAAPVGPLRYRPPAPPSGWDGSRDVTRFGVTAPQVNQPGGLFTPELPAGEDCLTLNVWTPTLEPAGLPVLVWIHGGAFLFGTGANPIVGTGTFARDGVVFVSINYRLGADGFLFVEGDPTAGNYGLLDQIAALQWVQDNIGRFGGDPTKVTVGGQSAGATSVAALLAAPAAEGLFSRAIMHSPYPEPLLSQPSARLVAREMYARAGLDVGDLDGLRALRERTPDRVLRIQMELFGDVLASHDDPERFGPEITLTVNPFQPVVGGAVIPARPIDALAARPRSVELLVGTTAEEFGLVYGAGMLSPDVDSLEATLENALPGRGSEALARYRAARPDASALDLLTAVESDRLYRAPAMRLASVHASSGAATYVYRFAWQSRDFGAGHSVDLPFVFDALDVPQARRFTGPNPPQSLADAMHRAWGAFVTTGRPDHDQIPPWPRYTAARETVMEFGADVRPVPNGDADLLRLWSAPLTVERSG